MVDTDYLVIFFNPPIQCMQLREIVCKDSYSDLSELIRMH